MIWSIRLIKFFSILVQQTWFTKGATHTCKSKLFYMQMYTFSSTTWFFSPLILKVLTMISQSFPRKICRFYFVKTKRFKGTNLTARQRILFYPHWLIQLGYLTDHPRLRCYKLTKFHVTNFRHILGNGVGIWAFKKWKIKIFEMSFCKKDWYILELFELL